MRALKREVNGRAVEYVNSELIPGFLFLPVEIMECFPPAAMRISRRVYDLLYDPQTIATVESSLFSNIVGAGYSMLSWPAMGQPEQTPESYSFDDPAYLFSRTPSIWIQMLEKNGILPDARVWALTYSRPDVNFGFPPLDYVRSIMEHLVPSVMDQLRMKETIKIARENLCHADFSRALSTQKRDFLRKWNHSRAKTDVLSLDALQQDAEAQQSSFRWEPADMEVSIDEIALDRVVADQFLGALGETDRKVLEMRNLGYNLSEIAEKLGFRTHSAVQKRIQKLGRDYEIFTGTDLGVEKERLSREIKKD